MEAKDKKPLYKRVWFWVVLILIIATVGGAGSQQAKKVGENNSSPETSSEKDNNSSPSSSEKNNTSEEKTEFKVGDIIAFDGKELTVEKVERNYDTGKTFVTPKDGKEFVKVNVKIENKSDDELSYNPFDFKIEDSEGSIENHYFMANADDEIHSGHLAKGGKKSGSVIFEVPAGSNLKLHYKPSFWSSKKVVINL